MDTGRHMGSWFMICVLVFCTPYILATPCDEYQEFPDVSKRNISNVLEAGQEPVSDAYLPNRNYFGTPGYKLAGNPPENMQCGTFFPVWIKDLPEDGVVGESIIRTACIVASNNCSLTMNITVHFCQNFQVYKLEQTPTDTAYCLEIAPIRIRIPTVSPTTQVDVRLDNSHFEGRTEFLCTFDVLKDPDLLYVTTWYINEQKLIEYPPVPWSADIHNNSRVNEDILRENNYKHAGFNIQCGVSTRYEIDFPSGPMGKSNERFIGIYFEPSHVTISDNTDVTVYLKTSIPFTCGMLLSNFPERCTFHVNVYHDTSEDGTCDRESFTKSACGVIMKSTDMMSEPLIISGDISDVISGSPVETRLSIQTEKDKFMLPFWSGYDIGHLKVTMIRKSSLADGKECKVWSDPYITTFDDSSYQNQLIGTFVLYKHATLPVEIHMKTEGDPGWSYACGVAIRVGGSVYVVDMCNWEQHFGFVECKDGTDIIGVKSSGREFIFDLPTGTSVQVVIDWMPVTDIHIFAGDADAEQTMGLCGTLNGNCLDDFKTRSGTTTNTNSSCNPDPWPFIDNDRFSETWRVDKNEDLFTHNGRKDLQLWSDEYVYCHCTKDFSTSSRNPQNSGSKCSKNRKRKCYPNSTFVTRNPSCKHITAKRRKRSTSNKDINADVHNDIVKRSASGWRNGWTEETARQTCEAAFNRSAAVSVCSELTPTNTSTYIVTCINDIKLSGSDKFTLTGLTSLRVSCIRHVEIHPETQKRQSEDTPSIYEVVLDSTCPSDCSGKGTCKKGRCTCEHPYGGTDCSIDMHLPPVTYGLADDGHCDLQKDDCTEPLITGEYFIESDSLKCRMTSYRIDKDGNMIYGIVSYTKPIVQHFGEINCLAPHSRKKRSLDPTEFDIARGYKIAVTNDGSLYSNESLMIIFNSSCQLCETVGSTVTCTFSTDSCIAQGVCISSGELYPGDKCLVCDTNGSPHWKLLTSCPDESIKPLWIIGIVLGAFVVIIIGIIAFVYYYNSRKGAKTDDTSMWSSPSKITAMSSPNINHQI